MINSDKNIIQKQFEGVRNTHQLWSRDSSIAIKQFKLNTTGVLEYNSSNHPVSLRLGKQVESFIEFEFESNVDINILKKNIQIQKEKLTIGELDLLLTYKTTPIHIEIVYKFYLYNPKVGNSFLEHWIGPNNNDSLIHKLNKLQNKQLPLLYKEETRPYLDKLQLKTPEIQQFVDFRAQLFLPLNSTIDFQNELNEDCVIGEYIELKDLDIFSENQFYIPKKLDWLIELHDTVEWDTFKKFNLDIEPSVTEERAVLFWMKTISGKLSKYFLYFNPK